MTTNEIKKADNEKLISELKWLAVYVWNNHEKTKMDELKAIEDEILSRMNK